MNSDVVSKLTIQDLYKDKRTRHLVIPYLKVLMKCGLINNESDCLNFNHSEFTIGEIDFDMCTNMGGGMPIEGWHEMISALLEFEFNEE